jgi:RNA-directed DNA polymerase
MDEENPQNPFERYADVIVIHCSSKDEAEQLLEKLKTRMHEYELELHPEKTKIVYCKNYHRNEIHDNNNFTFLSYSFQPRTVKDKFGRKHRLIVFNAAISQQA